MRWVPNNIYIKYGIKIENKKSWALVTGATDGIGLALCKCLARDHGFNIVMVARSEDKLALKREEILEYCKNSVEVEVET